MSGAGEGARGVEADWREGVGGVPPIDAELVSRLIAEQFPAWAALPVRPVDVDGWDNRSFRVGDDLVARLPSSAGYALQVRKEVAVLPVVAAGVALPVPEIVAVGAPGAGYPSEWTVRRWLPGTPVRDLARVDRPRLAVEVAAFLRELRAIPASGGPAAGPHSAGRGAPFAQFDDEVVRAAALAGDRIDADRARRIWHDARAATSSGPPRWFHGDLAVSNLLVADEHDGRGDGAGRGRLSAVIDFGCAGVGDPSCDLVLAWTLFDAAERAAFLDGVGADAGERRRGAGWALWKALITLDEPQGSGAARATLARLGVDRP